MQTIILCHGALGSKNDFENLKLALINNGFNVHSFSFSGHGNKEFETDFGIHQFSVELENFILHNKLIKPSVIGYSMGGYVALYLASRSVGSINKIITLATKFNWTKEIVEKETRMLDPKIMLEKVPAFAASLEKKHGSSWKDLLAKTSQMMWNISANNYLNAETLKAIQNKTLIGLGDKDQMVTLEETVSVYKILPNANMYMLPGTKHPIESIDTFVFVEVVKGFLKE
ncbi:MAG: alpha/beta fold hydrolase [Bacteroidota bacterium]|nr:alpha/beta fold hydrolase [Bacteroidota bacterium]